MWVLNEEEEFEKAFGYGVDGVMTDFPTKLNNFLAAHPELANKQHTDVTSQ